MTQSTVDIINYWSKYLSENGSTKTLAMLALQDTKALCQLCKVTIEGHHKDLWQPNWSQTLLSDLEYMLNDNRTLATEAQLNNDKPDTKVSQHNHGYIYLLRAIMPGGYYKIGRSKTPERRIKSMGVKLPFPIETIHCFPTDNQHKVEKYLHQKYADRHADGEWFMLSDQDVADICAIQVLNLEDIPS